MVLYHKFQIAITFAKLIPFIQKHVIRLQRSCKSLVKTDLMRTILFKSHQLLRYHSLSIVSYNNFYRLTNYTLFLIDKSYSYLPNFVNVAIIIRKIRKLHSHFDF